MVGFSWPCGCCDSTSYYTLRKFNSSAVVQWQIDGMDGDSSDNPSYATQGFHLNSDGTVILAGARAVSANGNGTINITKWDTSDQSFIWGINELDALGLPTRTSGLDVSADSNSDLWVSGVAEIIKINQSGTTQVTLTPADIEISNDNAVDSSDNVIASYVTDAGVNQYRIGKWDSSGTNQWDKLIEDVDRVYDPLYFVLDSSDNIYFPDLGGSFSGRPYLLKLDSDGDIVWVEDVSGDGWLFYNPIATDGTYLYVSSKHGSVYYVDVYDYSGTHQGSHATTDRVIKLAADSSGNFYTSEGDGIVRKYNSSGTVLQSYSYSGSGLDTITRIVPDGSDLYVSGLRQEI